MRNIALKRIIENIKTRLERCIQNGSNKHIPKEETLTYWLNENWQEGNMCPPPMSSVEFENFLIRYLLPKDYHTVLSMPDAQTRTQLLHDILTQHSKAYQKEYKEHLRRNKKE